MRVLPAIIATTLLSACMAPATDGPQGTVQAVTGGECDAGNAQSFIGREADIRLGEDVLNTTGAKTLRWIPPNSAVTMDYRTDRVSVSYDEAAIVTTVVCG